MATKDLIHPLIYHRIFGLYLKHESDKARVISAWVSLQVLSKAYIDASAAFYADNNEQNQSHVKIITC